jgi:hypothetical protein
MSNQKYMSNIIISNKKKNINSKKIKEEEENDDELIQEINDNKTINEDFENNKCIINLDKIYRVLGYKEKRLAIKLLNGKYNFIENIDYKIIDGITMITPQCFRLLCLLSRTDYGNDFRRFIVNKMFEFLSSQKIEINYEICPIPDVHIENLDIYDNKRIFYVINIKDDQYIYGITTDISMLISLLNDKYQIIINKIWLLNDKIQQDKLISESKEILGDNNLYPKFEKIKSCFRTNNIYDLLCKFNNTIKKLNN